MNKQYIVRVPVSTIWTKPDSPREIDYKAVSYPSDIRGWLQKLSTDDRRALTEENLVQSQVLYGQVVTLIDEKEGWLNVYVPEQPSSKLSEGYPGWLPKCQVNPIEETKLLKIKESFVSVTAPTAWLYEGGEAVLEISFQTRLPFVDQTEEWVTVDTPDGKRKLKASESKVSANKKDFQEVTGDKLVKTGEAFLELPYLWGGMSGFGLDCSGFSYTMHRAFGITIPRDASDQAKSGEFVDRSELKKGDLVYFAKDEGKGRVYHVGMYYGDGKMIHAPSAGKGIEIVALGTGKYDKDYSSARRYW